MKKYKATTKVILDTRRALQKVVLDTKKGPQDDTYPVKLRVTYKGLRQYYNIGYFMTEADFAKCTKEGKGKYKDNYLEFAKIESEAADVIKAMDTFSFEVFKKRFFDDNSGDDLFALLKRRIKEMEKAGRPGMASSLQSTLKAWQGFHKHTPLPFQQITVKKLTEFERHMRAKDKTPATIGIYQRNIRLIYNLAILKGIIKEEFYPFGRGLYEIPESENVKKALPKADILKIYRYETLPGSPEEYYRDLWVFSYLCNGMNVADIARLKYKDITSGKLVFRRKKTARRTKKPIIVEMTPEVAAIIERWGDPSRLPDTYIYGILKRSFSPAQELAAVKQVTKMVNTYIGRIAKSIGIAGTVTSYSARHSFASVLKLSGESVSFISEALGHQSLSTTENYLSSFNSVQRRKAQKKLL